jgi:hypothetical protein
MHAWFYYVLPPTISNTTTGTDTGMADTGMEPAGTVLFTETCQHPQSLSIVLVHQPTPVPIA